MTIRQPQRDLPVGLRGGADTWDQPQADVILADDWLAVAASSISGSISANEVGQDSLVSSGFITAGSASISGTLSATEQGHDAAVISGARVTTGSASSQEPLPDQAAISGFRSSIGSASSQESLQDTLASSGFSTRFAALSAQEDGQDSATSTGLRGSVGSASAFEVGQDTAFADGFVGRVISGALFAQETGFDTLAADGRGPISGILAASEPSGIDVQILVQAIWDHPQALTLAKFFSDGLGGGSIAGYPPEIQQAASAVWASQKSLTSGKYLALKD